MFKGLQRHEVMSAFYSSTLCKSCSYHVWGCMYFYTQLPILSSSQTTATSSNDNSDDHRHVSYTNAHHHKRRIIS